MMSVGYYLNEWKLSQLGQEFIDIGKWHSWEEMQLRLSKIKDLKAQGGESGTHNDKLNY